MDSHSQHFRWRFGSCVFDDSSLELTVAGAKVELERKPLEVLRHLLRHAGEVVTKDELQNAVWAGRILSETVLTKAVSRIREELGDEGLALIKTVHGYGYRLVAAVSVEAAAAAPLPVLGLKMGDSPPNRPQWRLARHLGNGSSGEVWLVEHGKTGDLRVCKFALRAEALDGLKREITLFRLLRQQLGEAAPILEIFDWNLEEAPYFLEMRYYPEGNLHDWALSQPGGLASLPLAQRLQWFVQLAESVGAVHQVGVIHKDLKPANILVSQAKQGGIALVLADFGGGGVLADDVIANAGITRLGFTRLDSVGQGSTLYLAPEVLEGQPLTLKSDLYALGVMLYQFCIGDFRKPISPGWEQGIEDPLIREDIAAAVQGNPARRIAAATELAERIRRLEERRAEREAEAAQVELAAQAEQRIEAAQLRLDRLKVRRKWMMATMAIFVAGTIVAGLFAWRAEQANRRTQAAMRFLLDDVFGGFSLKQGPAKQITVNSLVERAAKRVDERFPASDVASRAQAYSALWDLYGITDFSTFDFTFSDWLQEQMLTSTTAWFAQSPESAYSMAYRTAVSIDFWNNNPKGAQLTAALSHYADARSDLPAAQKLHLAAKLAEEHIKSGELALAAAGMQAISPTLLAEADALLEQEPFTLFTSIQNSSRLNLVALGRQLCERMTARIDQAPLKDDTNLRLEYLSACTVSAHQGGDVPTTRLLGQQGLALARANYDDMVGYVPTFLRFIGSAELAAGRPREGLAALDEAAALRRKLEDGLLPYVLAGRGMALEALGENARALADYREASDALVDAPFPLLAIEAHARYARRLALDGDAAAARKILARIPAVTIAQLPAPNRGRTHLLQAQAAIAAAEGQHEDAKAKLSEAAQILVQLGFPEDHGWRQEIAAQVPRPSR